MAKKKLKPKRTGEITIKKKALNNKSRKGWYYYIRAKDKRPAYYKITEGVNIENYLLAYQGKVKIKKKGVVQYTKETPAQKYLQKVEKKGMKIDDLISKGITEATLTNLRFSGKKKMHNAYIQMLSPLVKDKKLLEILALEENVNKFKHRIETLVTVRSGDGKQSFELKTFNKSLIEIENDFQEIMGGSQVFERNLRSIMKKGYRLASLPQGFDMKNYEKNFIAKNIGSIKVKLKFVKAK